MRRMRATDQRVLRGIVATVALGTLAAWVVAATLARQAATSADALGRGLAHPLLATPAGGRTPAPLPPAAPPTRDPEATPARGTTVRSTVAGGAGSGGGADVAVGKTTVTGATLETSATGEADATTGDAERGAR